jgi:hypothetical protein
VGLRERIEQIERFLSRVHLLWWLLPSSVLTMITGLLGYVRDAPFVPFVIGLIAAFTIPSLGLAALFSAADRFRKKQKSRCWTEYTECCYRRSYPGTTDCSGKDFSAARSISRNKRWPINNL